MRCCIVAFFFSPKSGRSGGRMIRDLHSTTAVQSYTVQCNAMQCNAMQCDARLGLRSRMNGCLSLTLLCFTGLDLHWSQLCSTLHCQAALGSLSYHEWQVMSIWALARQCRQWHIGHLVMWEGAEINWSQKSFLTRGKAIYFWLDDMG